MELLTSHSYNPDTIREALIELYLSVKVRKADDIDQYNEKLLQEEKENLKNIDILVLIGYIKTSIEILMNLKNEDEKLQKSEVSSIISDKSCEQPKKYEEALQKLEDEVRSHIRVFYREFY